MQKLILPINKARLTASYKNEAYYKKFGFHHYGIDLCDAVAPFDRTVWGMGNGEIIDTGWDSCFGNYVVVKYGDAYNNKTSKSSDLIIRLFHFNSVNVKNGDKITKDTKFGEYGDTGSYAEGKHLHLEVDTDTKYTHYTPTLSQSSSKFFGRNSNANDKTMSNPLEWINCKTTSPDNQTFICESSSYINLSDKAIVSIT